MSNHEKLIRGLNEVAKKNLQKNGRLTPIAFLIREGKIVAPILLRIQTDEEKPDVYKSIGMIAKKFSADSVIIVQDAALKVFKTKEESKYVLENLATEKPLMYPENMRQDGIFFFVIDLKTKETNGYFQEYEKKGKDIHFHKLINYLELVKDSFSPDSDEGKLGGSIVDCVLKGYKMNMEKELISPEIINKVEDSMRDIDLN